MQLTDRPTTESTDGTSDPASDDAPPDPAGPRPMSPAEIASTYDDVVDRFERWEWLERLVAGRYRRRLFGDVDGRVLDVACGTGTNFRYLPATVELAGVDISPEMLRRARVALEAADCDGQLYEMDAQALAFPDDHFDAVVSALSTCTFPDPVAALREMDRVCRPGGRILLLEHGRSSVGPIARFQDWRADSHYAEMGCRWNQEPLALVEEAGLTVEVATTRFAGVLTAIEARAGDDE